MTDKRYIKQLQAGLIRNAAYRLTLTDPGTVVWCDQIRAELERVLKYMIDNQKDKKPCK
jgi:hypothetical protein